MRKLFNYGRAMLAAALLMVCFSAKATDCSVVTNTLCNGFDTLTAQVHNSDTLEELMALDPGTALQNSFEGIPDECSDALLTKDDKDRIKKSISRFFDAFGNKTVSLSNGLITEDQMKQIIDPMNKLFMESLDKSDTLTQFAENLIEVQM